MLHIRASAMQFSLSMVASILRIGISGSFRNAIDAFMNDDISDDSGTDDYPF